MYQNSPVTIYFPYVHSTVSYTIICCGNTKQYQKTLRRCESSETAHPTHHTVRNSTPNTPHRRIPQDFNPEQHRCENITSCRDHLFILCNVIKPLQPVITICTAQWSPYVRHSGHYLYAQWSLYVPHNGHYMYRTVVTVCTAQWSLYVPQSGHYMYRTVVTICTTSLTFSNSTFCPHSAFSAERTQRNLCLPPGFLEI